MAKCSHYERHCALVSPCCSKVYTCRLCHDDAEDHTIDRYSVTQVKCLQCETVQKVQKTCEKCNTVFGAYFCGICRMFDDKDKKQFHCEPCGLCRIGGRDNYFHCPRCDMCYGIALKDKHRCIDKVTRADCPICLEDLHTSVRSIHVPKCTHLLHQDCYVSCLKTGHFACPLCGTSVVEMAETWKHLDHEIAETPMPSEYRNTKMYVLCKDCHETTQTPFHVLGLKCQACGSYNTCTTDDPTETSVKASGSGDGNSGANAQSS